MRVIFITLECADPVFSGNGTYSRSLINSLLHHKEVELCVVCASPSDPKIDLFPADWLSSPLFHYFVISVPNEKWYRHDIKSSWEDFANGFDREILEKLAKFDPDIIIGVDWPALQPYQKVRSVVKPTVPYVYLNFRVFHASSGIPEHDREIYKTKEYDSCVCAAKTITLSPADTRSLCALTASLPQSHSIFTLLPPLPRKIHTLATSYHPPANKFQLNTAPRYLLCCVRLSPEKNVEVFVEVCNRLSSFLAEQNIVPYLCGAAQTKEYAEKLRNKLKEVHPPSIIVEEVLSHDALVEVYKKTVLNFHPALYEAYGLTIVEAAAFGVPSIVNQGGDIGATALLQPKKEESDAQRENDKIRTANEVFITKMEDVEQVAKDVQAILDPKNIGFLVEVASRARTKSLSYGEHENGEHFLQHLKTLHK